MFLQHSDHTRMVLVVWQFVFCHTCPIYMGTEKLMIIIIIRNDSDGHNTNVIASYIFKWVHFLKTNTILKTLVIL